MQTRNASGTSSPTEHHLSFPAKAAQQKKSKNKDKEIKSEENIRKMMMDQVKSKIGSRLCLIE